VSMEELLEMTSTPMAAITDLPAIRNKIVAEFASARTSDQHASLLAMFKAAMDIAEAHVAKTGTQQQLEELQKARAYDYKSLVIQECMVGLDSPVVGGDVSVEMLMAVTAREVAAGRMTEDHSVRKLAITASAAPYLTHAQLLERDAKLKGARSSKAEAIGVVLGRKVKGLFGRK
jgi:hypothetical protein